MRKLILILAAVTLSVFTIGCGDPSEVNQQVERIEPQYHIGDMIETKFDEKLMILDTVGPWEDYHVGNYKVKDIDDVSSTINQLEIKENWADTTYPAYPGINRY